MPATVTCQFPGCERPVAEPTADTGRRPAYCDEPQHTRESAFRERQRLRKEGVLPPIEPADPHARPVTMAATSLALNLDGLTSRAAELRDVADRVEDAVATIADTTALELELDALRAGADLEVSRVRAELATYQQQMGADVKAARAQLAGEQQRRTEKESDLAEARDALERARGETQELRASLVAAQDEREVREAEHSRNLEAAETELARLRAELERVGTDLAQAAAAAEEHSQRAARLQSELDGARQSESAGREALAAERAAREGAQQSASDARDAAAHAERTAEQLVASERARAEEARSSAQDARAERDRALERASRAEKHAERLQDRVTGLEARLDAQPPAPPKRPARPRKPDGA